MRIPVVLTSWSLIATMLACGTRGAAATQNDSAVVAVVPGDSLGKIVKDSLRVRPTDSSPDRQRDSLRDQEKNSATRNGTVHTDMQHVNMHIEPGIVLSIDRLRGTVLPANANAPPALNDKGSMIINIQAGDIAIDTLSLATLLNRHVFGYAKSPLRKLHVFIDRNEMVQTGEMKKLVWLSFRIRAAMSLTPDGEIRVHPTAIRVAGIGVKGLSAKLGGLGKLVKLEPGHGARIEGDDFILSPTEMLPPPRIRGTLTSIKLEPSGLRQTFGSEEASRVPLTHRPGSTAKNFMYFHGGTLRFGKLTMSGTDLEIVDMDQSNPFDYALDRYQEHLVAGHSNTTPADGLIVVMPDVQRLRKQ
ncbi:MAG: hypothetical protein ABJB66_10165 [Gemmatimonadaceae bacterium]